MGRKGAKPPAGIRKLVVCPGVILDVVGLLALIGISGCARTALVHESLCQLERLANERRSLNLAIAYAVSYSVVCPFA